MEWEDWAGYGLEILESFGIATKSISLQEAETALEYVCAYCEKKRTGWSPLRGLLKSADHFASAFMHETEKKLKVLFEKPDFSFYWGRDRQSEIYPLSKTDALDAREHTLVVAPTGAGKTDFLLKRCRKKSFFIHSPFRHQSTPCTSVSKTLSQIKI
ncbi:MAG: hypothetical protein HC912_11800 [Saprospiraceae bacterium]|nr:hypothetical protein [Saprospiraceae bacterium]